MVSIRSLKRKRRKKGFTVLKKQPAQDTTEKVSEKNEDMSDFNRELSLMDCQVDNLLSQTKAHTEEVLEPDREVPDKMEEFAKILNNSFASKVYKRYRESPHLKELKRCNMFFCCKKFDFMKKYFEKYYIFTTPEGVNIDCYVLLAGWKVYSWDIFNYLKENDPEFFNGMEIEIFDMGEVSDGN